MSKSSASTRIVLASSFLADYPCGGGHWTWFLQYLLGLDGLGLDVFLIELMSSSGNAHSDREMIDSFFARLDRYGFRGRAILLLTKDDQPVELETVSFHGSDLRCLRETIASADLLWNVCGALPASVSSLFRRRVLVDVDPGIYQLSALDWDMGLGEHEVLLTVGANVGTPNCEVPTLGRQWHAFRPFVHLPAWPVMPDPGVVAPFTSVTQWRWADEVFEWKGGLVSTSKREAYLRYIEVPMRSGRPLELAANIHPDDDTGDRELLQEHGWRLAQPEQIARTPELYRDYIRASRAEFACVKPIYSELRTGWISDRSVCYLATGRPVICEETGVADSIPTGEGMLTFSTPDEAVAIIAEVDAKYDQHARAARELAESFFDARRCLADMLARCR